MSQWLVNLFSRRVSPLELEVMTYAQLRFWNGAHEAMARAEHPEE